MLLDRSWLATVRDVSRSTHHVISPSRPSPAFRTASDKSWAWRPGNEATKCSCCIVCVLSVAGYTVITLVLQVQHLSLSLCTALAHECHKSAFYVEVWGNPLFEISPYASGTPPPVPPHTYIHVCIHSFLRTHARAHTLHMHTVCLLSHAQPPYHTHTHTHTVY